jgi:hypothetical protein
MKTKLFSIIMILAILFSIAVVASAAPAINQEPDLAGKPDNRMDPMSAQQAALRQTALEAKANMSSWSAMARTRSGP